MYLKKLVDMGNRILTKLLLILIMLFVFQSCSRRYYVRKTHRLSEKIQNELYKKNNNSFYLSLDYATRSYVFSQNNGGKTTWIEIKNGKIYNEKTCETQKYNLKKTKYNRELYYNCYDNMDYFLFFSVADSGDVSYLDLKCLDTIKKDNIFLNYIYEAIKCGEPYKKEER